MTIPIGVLKKQTRAVLLAELLGAIGPHHFYLRQPFFAGLYLVFCCTYFPGVSVSDRYSRCHF